MVFTERTTHPGWGDWKTQEYCLRYNKSDMLSGYLYGNVDQTVH